ncbi:bacillithiol biosynthesis cysteine-adding enzyme BshC [Flavobacterium sp.]|uniref:bacillithiol biosynthesis cysteine-adding enzyme BshC n=1 Tax=Flavobacterium sp. TaxID=239 RepID=UPI003753929E
MPTDCISYQKSGYFSKLIIDYLEKKPELEQLYNSFPTIENFKNQIEEKEKNFYGIEKREVLVDVLENQYSKIEISELTKQNISLLKDTKTFTITTGHQLNLFTGPLYFLYKIISTINLCKQLKGNYPEYNFVPIYWMATEDHDFEEINHFNFKGKKFRWNTESKGPVGRLSTEGLSSFFDVFRTELGSSNNAESLKKLFSDSYLQHSNLAEATRFLANELFGEYGLVILDGDSAALKKQFIPYIKDELLYQNSNKKVQESISKLKDYSIQVNPREINLFYIEDKLRERIIYEGNYKVNNTNIEFSETEILNLVEINPEKFSPNVILRPLYQEVILPNLAYIGGGGEIAYWLELKAMFDFHKVTFPILLVRNSVVLINEKQETKMTKLNISWEELFLKQQVLIDAKTNEFSEINIDFSEQKTHLKKQFEALHNIVLKTDKSFAGAVNAQEKKQIKGLENLEKRLLKAEKKVHTSKLESIVQLQNELFPNKSLQERKFNFSEFYLETGNQLFTKLIKELKPLSVCFSTVKI